MGVFFILEILKEQGERRARKLKARKAIRGFFVEKHEYVDTGRKAPGESEC